MKFKNSDEIINKVNEAHIEDVLEEAMFAHSTNSDLTLEAFNIINGSIRSKDDKETFIKWLKSIK